MSPELSRLPNLSCVPDLVRFQITYLRHRLLQYQAKPASMLLGTAIFSNQLVARQEELAAFFADVPDPKSKQYQGRFVSVHLCSG